MAEKKPKKRVLRKTETVREKAAKPKTEPRRRKLTAKATKAAGKASGPFKRAKNFGKREYYLPLPDNKLGRFLNKRRSIIPKYFKESWTELRQVEWPTNKQTMQLTFAVFIFAIAIGAVVALVDYGLGKAFEALILE